MRELKVQLDRIEISSGECFVVRDDLLAGGTKERACADFLRVLSDRVGTEFVYASPFCGFAQVALARACEELGQQAVIFAARDPNFEELKPHEYSRLAESKGARVIVCETLFDAHSKSLQYAEQTGAVLVPLGFDHPEFRRLLSEALTAVWESIRASSNDAIQRLWVPVGSGTLAKCLRTVVPKQIELKLINVNVLKTEDSRMMEVMKLKNSTFENAPEEFEQPSSAVPPVPSNLHYDAKLWQFLMQKGRRGDAWWNVAR